MIPQLPERFALTREVTKVLRQGLTDGHWRDYLPSERQLSDELHVSRETLRWSLQAIEEEGLIQRHGLSRRKIVVSPATTDRRQAKVVLLAPIPIEQWESRGIIRTDRLRQYLAAANLEFIIRHGTRFFSAQSHHALAELVQNENAGCWILSGSTLEVQRWFADRKLPAIVMGPCFEGLALNSLDFDFRSVCRHAAGQLLGLGHARIALIVRQPESAGDSYARAGFLEAFNPEKAGLDPLLLKYDGSIASLQRSLDRAFLSPHAPTALIGPPRQIHTAVLHLAQRRLIASQDYAFISRSDDPILDTMIPSVAHYVCHPVNMAQRLFRAVTKIIKDPHHPRRHLRLMPGFISGDSLHCKKLSRNDRRRDAALT